MNSSAPSKIACTTGVYYTYSTEWGEGEWREIEEEDLIEVDEVLYVRADLVKTFKENLS